MKNVEYKYYLYTFFSGFHFFSAVLIPFFTEWGHISLFQVQLLQAWFLLWIFLLEIPTGVIADYFGRKYSLALGSLIVVFATLIYGSVPHFYVFLLGEFLFAMGVALTSGADDAWLYDSLKEQKREFQSKTIFGKAHAIGLFGIMLAAPIGSIIATKIGIQWPLLLTSLSALCAAGIALTMQEPKKVKTTSEKTRYLIVAKEGFTFFYTHPTLRLLALDGIIVACAAYFVIWFYQPLLIANHMPIVYFGIIHALLVGSEIVVASNFARFESCFGSAKQFLRFSALITAAMFLLVGVFPHPITILLFIIFAGGFGMTRIELVTVYMQRHIPSDKRATVLSSISMFRRLGLIFLNPIIGLAAVWSLSFALLILACIPLTLFLFSPIEQEMLDNHA